MTGERGVIRPLGAGFPRRKPVELSEGDRAGIEILRGLRSPEVSKSYEEALIQLASGRLREGVETILKIPEGEDESDFVTTSKLAEVYIRYGRVHDGLLPYEKAHKTSEPQEEKYYHMLATAYSQMGRHNDAREIYRKALRLLGDSADLRVRIAQTYEMEGRLYRASKEYELIKDEYPNDSYVANQLALSYIRTKRDQRAREVYQEVLEMGADDSLEEAIACIGLRKPERALEALRETIERYPEDALPYYYTALAYVMLDDWDQVGEHLLKGLRREPGLWYGDVETFTRWALEPGELSRLIKIWPEEVVVSGE